MGVTTVSRTNRSLGTGWPWRATSAFGGAISAVWGTICGPVRRAHVFEAAALACSLAVLAALVSWLGVENATAVGMVLVAAGNNPVASATVAGNIEFDHVWVEADIPLSQGQGTLTVQLDPSWKFKEFQTGISGMLARVPFDMDGFLQQVRPERVFEWERLAPVTWGS